MALNLKLVLLGLFLIGGNTVFAKSDNFEDLAYYTIKSFEVHEIKNDYVTDDIPNFEYYKDVDINDLPVLEGPIENTGKIIGLGKDLVALGEDIYRLVIKGKPAITTKYAPISVVPKLNDGPVDILSTENWKMPVKKTFKASYVNLYGMEVVVFRYAVIFAHSGSYEGKGAYLTAVQVVPESVRTMFGYEFTATMKLGGIQNNGTRANPVAGATLLMEHTVSTVMKAHTEVDTFFITGNGEFKKF